MPLPASPSQREKQHTRQIICEGYRRTDDLWDIEGRLTDTKEYGFDNVWRGWIEKGEPLHDMGLRLTIDDNFFVKAVEAFSDKTPFQVCPAILPAFQQLVGLQMAAGWTKKTRALLGGVRGCTHLVDLLGPMATTAFQTIMPIKAREKGQPAMPAFDDETGKHKRPPLINSCHAFAQSGDVVKNRWPEWHEETNKD